MPKKHSESRTRKVTRGSRTSTEAPTLESERPIAPPEPETVIVPSKTEVTTVIVPRAMGTTGEAAAPPKEE